MRYFLLSYIGRRSQGAGMRSRPDPDELEFGFLAIFIAIGLFKMVVGAVFALAAAL